ncbi:MAG: hypothetical protein M3Z23_15500, partial [Acidobacteriota bacterium]|nr:hypothetical protein [Acidobacteriota bacterium]
MAASRIAAGDGRLQIVEGTDLLGRTRADGLVDGTHPNDLGFEWMAEGLAPPLRTMLRLSKAIDSSSGKIAAGVRFDLNQRIVHLVLFRI